MPESNMESKQYGVSISRAPKPPGLDTKSATFLVVHIDDGNTNWSFDHEKNCVDCSSMIPVWPDNSVGNIRTIRHGKIRVCADHFYYGYNRTGCKHCRCTIYFDAPFKDVKAAGIDLSNGAKEVHFNG